jgi:hypothetical protein
VIPQPLGGCHDEDPAKEKWIMTDHPLREAYEGTDYRVGDRFTIRCGALSAPLDALLNDHRHDHWAYITACNPGSLPLDDAENRRRMADLARRLACLGLPMLAGEGVGDGDDWPPEPSLLVLGIGQKAAVELGRELGQVAIVIGRLGEPARLCFCSPPPRTAGET